VPIIYSLYSDWEKAVQKNVSMADVHDKKTRSFNMSQIKGKNTKPEMLVRRFLHANGFRYRLHVKDLPGKPDLVLPKYKTIIDVRGCFWHGHTNCNWGDKIKSESAKIMGRVRSAVKRDLINEKKWAQLGWNVIIVWDSCELEVKKKNSDRRATILTNILKHLKNQLQNIQPKNAPKKKVFAN
jgi:DNA mismatch endonuclease (patch repair protein)